jgi:N-acetylglutamate synthase-like GNAT family acetyltransferase
MTTSSSSHPSTTNINWPRFSKRPRWDVGRRRRSSRPSGTADNAVFALRRGRLVGAGRAFGDEVDCAVICDLAVHPDSQAKGLGERILETLKQNVRHHLRIILYAKPGKESFYLKRGFNRMRTAMLTSSVVPLERNRESGIIE